MKLFFLMFSIQVFIIYELKKESLMEKYFLGGLNGMKDLEHIPGIMILCLTMNEAILFKKGVVKPFSASSGREL